MIKEKRITIRLEDKEYNHYKSILAKKKYSNLDMSKMIRLALKNFTDNRKFEATETFNALYLVLLQNTIDLSRVTGNLNQIAYHLNKDDIIENKEIVEHLNEFTDIHKKVYKDFLNLREEVEKMI
ncbi:hypothetical protein AAX26_01664 [Aliarcobacter thereius]|uniref:hypothetical protein n=1 Tax=Aliarcobacter thereius TaxID=544718 RepID=UPI0008293C45|nr:hypothetical protein [Aliarcobacter thereius]OCL86014.1 hypothetical protein AAX26_01664 [Aliarcobacter thereius]